jgi:hypothetical protein
MTRASEEPDLGPVSREIQLENSREVSQETPMPNDFVLTESDKSRSAMNLEPENDIILSKLTSQEIQPDDSPTVSHPIDIADDFVAFEKTKKGKKTKDKSSTRELDQTTLVPTSEDVDDSQEFVMPGS